MLPLGFLALVLHPSYSFELGATLCVGKCPYVADAPETGGRGNIDVQSKSVFIQRQSSAVVQTRVRELQQQATGSCTNRLDGAACDDADANTDCDMCTAGECAGTLRRTGACFNPGNSGRDTGYLRGERSASKSSCEQACTDQANCSFYSYGSDPGNWDCLLYSSCDGEQESLWGHSVLNHRIYALTCEAKAECSTITCRTGYVPNSAKDATLCALATCDSTGDDNDLCCDARSTCSTITCRTGYVPNSASDATLCELATCDSTGDDNELCCEADPCVGVTCPSSACKEAGTCFGGSCLAGVNLADGTSCDDENANTYCDVCTVGVCRGTEQLFTEIGTGWCPSQSVSGEPNFLGGQKHASKSSCEQLCVNQADCLFFSFGWGDSPEWDCLLYSACAKFNTNLHGHDMLNHKIYKQGC